MFRFINGLIAVAIAVLVVIILLKIAVFIAGTNPIDVAKVAIATIAIIAFMAALQAAAQIIGLFMHVRRR